MKIKQAGNNIENIYQQLAILADLDAVLADKIDYFIDAKEVFNAAVFQGFSEKELSSQRVLKAIEDVIINPYIHDIPDRKLELVSHIYQSDEVIDLRNAASDVIEYLETVEKNNEHALIKATLANMVGVLCYYYIDDRAPDDDSDYNQAAEMSFEYALQLGLDHAKINFLAAKIERISDSTLDERNDAIAQLYILHEQQYKQASIILGRDCVARGDMTMAAAIFASAAHLGHDGMQKALAFGEGVYALKIEGDQNSPLSREDIMKIVSVIADYADDMGKILGSGDYLLEVSRLLNPESAFIGQLVKESASLLTIQDIAILYDDIARRRQQTAMRFLPNRKDIIDLKDRSKSLKIIAKCLIEKLFGNIKIAKIGMHKDHGIVFALQDPMAIQFLGILPKGVSLFNQYQSTIRINPRELRSSDIL